MNLYLDDDSTNRVVIRLLCGGGHEVATPADIGLAGQDDPVHLTAAIEHGWALLTCDSGHFAQLHALVLASGGRHPGMLVVRRDNDPTRDMTPRGIARTIAKLLASEMRLADGFHVLNHWR